MTYRVIIMPRAESDLRTIYRYICDQAPRAATSWLKRARKAAKTLAHYPERCPLAPESASFDEPIRQLLFGSGSRNISLPLHRGGRKSLRAARTPWIDAAAVVG